MVSLAVTVTAPATAHATGFSHGSLGANAPAPASGESSTAETPTAQQVRSQETPAAPAPAPAAPTPAAPAAAATPAAPAPAAATPAPATAAAASANVPIRPTRSAELAKIERGTSRALMISGIVFGVTSVAWGAAFVSASYAGAAGEGAYSTRDAGFVATGWTGGLALSITSATLLPIGLSRRANARIAEGLSPDTLEAESRGLTTGIILASAGGLMMITSPLLFSESSSLSSRQANTMFAGLFPASIVMIGAGSGLIAAANRIRNERRRQIIYSATPYFGRDMVGVGVSGRF